MKFLIVLLFAFSIFTKALCAIRQESQNKKGSIFKNVLSLVPEGANVAFWSIIKNDEIVDDLISTLKMKQVFLTIIFQEKFTSAMQFDIIIFSGGDQGNVIINEVM